MSALRLEGICRSFGRGPLVVDNVDLAVTAGDFFCLLGPSGCGKTTLLRLVGGYLAPDRGRIWLDGTDITHRPLEQRNSGMVFQHYALFPHLSARANVAFGLEARRFPRAEIRGRVETMLDRVGLSAPERDRRPGELSGGQQQRVALARALVIEPQLLLLDEPLANLDRKLREQLRDELKELQQRTGVTTVFVTHDQEEALALADQVGLMLAGHLLQIGSPRELYERPRTPGAARFLGLANLLEVVALEANALHLRGGGLVARAGLPAAAIGSWILIRPERVVLGSSASSCPYHWEAQVSTSVFLGADQLLQVSLPGPGTMHVRCRPDQVQTVQVGTTVPVGIPADALWVIPECDPPWLVKASESRIHADA